MHYFLGVWFSYITMSINLYRFNYTNVRDIIRVEIESDGKII